MNLKRVGFIFFDDIWTGGENYYSNLFYAVKQNSLAKIQIVCFVSNKCSSKFIEKMNTLCELIIFPYFDTRSLPFRILEKIFNLRAKQLNKLCALHQIDIASHIDARLMTNKLSIPMTGWITDFQHVKMPEFFSKLEIRRRNNDFLITAKNSTIVILSSKDAYHDFAKMMPQFATKGKVLNFVSQVSTEKPSETEWESLQIKYGIKTKFFYIPNQLWKHKNHLAAIKALKIIRDNNYNCSIICTGNTSDYRHPSYFKELKQTIQNYGLEHDFKILGQVSFNIVNHLIHKSIAIINPSFFEGWSTTVEESKAIGKPIILSNISVHLEQNPKHGHYFNPNKPEELAAQMIKLLATQQDFIDSNYNQQLKTIEFALNYESIILEAIQSKS